MKEYPLALQHQRLLRLALPASAMGSSASSRIWCWDAIPAVANNALYEVKSPLILQPGPAALTDGLDALCELINRHREV
ncbi:hypothetical protein [Vreelandella utahensis]|uniref:hypothetical protein n=1 Tax=Vreelandella halophila TaxID=86177 RepID=UPI001C4E14C1|nr:hypothetical protein [Halomonas utahensis]